MPTRSATRTAPRVHARMRALLGLSTYDTRALFKSTDVRCAQIAN